MNKLSVNWTKILACTQEEKENMLPFIEDLIFLRQECRERGIEGFENFLADEKDNFKKIAVKLAYNGSEPEIVTEILNNLLLSTNLSNAKYLEYVIFARLILIIQCTNIQHETLRIFLKSYLGMDFSETSNDRDMLG